MPIVSPSNNFLAGVDKQTNEATVATAADYSLPVYESTIEIVEATNVVEITDASSIEGDPYKGPQSWQANLGFPMYAASSGRFLQGLWPTDNITGSDPYTHTYSGLGGTQSFHSVYAEWPGAGPNEHIFGKGLCTRTAWVATETGGPLRMEVSYVGQEAMDLDWTVGTADGLANGYFQLQASGAKIELDIDTPNSNPSAQPEDIRNFNFAVNRPVTPEPVVDSFSVSSLSQGKVSFEGSMDWLFSSWDVVNTTYFGGTTGTSASSTIVYGALELTAKHSVNANWLFTLYIPKVRFRAGYPTPNPDGSALVIPITMHVADPTSGDHVQPILINGVTPAY
jgi:hypothetical protein